MGPVDLAAHQIAFEIWSILALALDAIAIAGQAMVGRLLGAGDAGRGPRARAGGCSSGASCSASWSAPPCSPPRTVLPRVFTDDPAVVDLAGVPPGVGGA